MKRLGMALLMTLIVCWSIVILVGVPVGIVLLFHIKGVAVYIVLGVWMFLITTGLFLVLGTGIDGSNSQG